MSRIGGTRPPTDGYGPSLAPGARSAYTACLGDASLNRDGQSGHICARLRGGAMRLLSSIRSALREAAGGYTRCCTHVDQIRDLPTGSHGCQQCAALGDDWVHLRMCMTCGMVGCCD